MAKDHTGVANASCVFLQPSPKKMIYNDLQMPVVRMDNKSSTLEKGFCWTRLSNFRGYLLTHLTMTDGSCSQTLPN